MAHQEGNGGHVTFILDDAGAEGQAVVHVSLLRQHQFHILAQVRQYVDVCTLNCNRRAVLPRVLHPTAPFSRRAIPLCAV